MKTSAYVVLANLVAKACGSGLIVDFSDSVHLDEVVSGPQCPELVSSAFPCSVRDESSIGTRDSAEFFCTIQVGTRGISFVHHPARTFMQTLVQLSVAQTQLSMRTHAARAIRVQARSDILQVRFDLLNRS